MKIKNNKLAPLVGILTNISFPTTISVESISGLVSLTSSVIGLKEQFDKKSFALFNSYGIEDVNGSFSWVGHDEQDVISEKVNELYNMDNIVDLSFSEKDLHAKLAAGRHIQEVLFLKDILYQD